MQKKNRATIIVKDAIFVKFGPRPQSPAKLGDSGDRAGSDCCGMPQAHQAGWGERLAVVDEVAPRGFQAMWVPAGTVMVW